MFTNTDKALFDRTARMLDGQAKGLAQQHATGSWGASKVSRKAKLEYDRLQRDARDLRELGKRLMALAKRKGVEQTIEQLPGMPSYSSGPISTTASNA